VPVRASHVSRRGAAPVPRVSWALLKHAGRQGEIRVGELFKDFRAHLADDIAAQLTLSDEDARPFVSEIAELSIAAMNFAYAVIGAYTDGMPHGTFETIRA
jgi:hypothetical protein